ncbi:MAG TPA: hypothetical protein VNE40_04730 [Candidatus Dormibacteraeota bacterium]|nr:hypothetical protein [Candidatus Dormibacteraeota bacterium]
MRRIENNQGLTGLICQDSAEVFMVGRIIHAYSSEEALVNKANLFLERIIGHQTMPELEQFIGPEADLIVNGLKHIMTFANAEGWQAAEAAQMLGQYFDPDQRERDLTIEHQQQAFYELAADIEMFEKSGKIS